MKKRNERTHLLCKCFVLCMLLTLFAKARSQTITINYQNTGMPVGNCLFNSYPGPASPFLIKGYNHYGIVGGIDYTGNEMVMATDNRGGGSGFGIYFSFSPNYKYTISVIAKASSPSINLVWAINKNRTNTPTSCSPGFAKIITQNTTYTSSFKNLTQNYVTYTLTTDFTPSSTGFNYLLLSAFNDLSAVANCQIQSITITQSPLCKPPTLLQTTLLGNGLFKVTFAHPDFTDPIDSYEISGYLPGDFSRYIPPFYFGYTLDKTATSATVGGKPGTYTYYLFSKCSGVNSAIPTYTITVK